MTTSKEFSETSNQLKPSKDSELSGQAATSDKQSTSSITPYANNLDHLKDEFHRLALLLEKAVLQFRARRGRDTPTEFQGLYISDKEIDDLMATADEALTKAWAKVQSKLTRRHEEIQQRIIETQRASILLRLPHLGAVFGLSLFETDLLLLALAPELDLRYQKLYAYLQDDVTRKRPSVDLSLRLFCVSLEERVQAREIFAENAPLMASSLLVLSEDPADRPAPLLNRFVKLDDRVAEFILGSDQLDRRLAANSRLAHWVMPQMELRDLILAPEIKSALERFSRQVATGAPWLCFLHGPSGSGKKAAAEAICKANSRSLLVLDLPAMLTAETPLPILLRFARREAQLYGSALYVDGWHELMKNESLSSTATHLLQQEFARFPGLVFLGSRSAWQPSQLSSHKFIQLELPLPDDRLRQQLWETSLRNGYPVDPNVDLKQLAGAFRLSGGQIRRAIAHAQTHAQLRHGQSYEISVDDLLAGCRAESTQHLISFARKISPKRVWNDLVLPKDTLTHLKEFCQFVRYRTQVYGEWGFDRKISLGKGIVVLFTGTSGTGKTLSAEIMANELGLDLYKVDLSCVVSKYIGETEKNLSRVFQDAQESNAILFFDEADALFGKRSEVKDAHDRYANIEINYLLQRVEEYEGVIILASNMSKNIDPAFLRRMHFSIEFPFPDEDYRLRIWRDIFPTQAPLANDIDFDFLARKFKIAGGNIKNVAVAAAFRAADNGNVIRMDHLILALKREYQKLGKVCEKIEFEQYYDLVR
ncbi:MAG: AAA family ATPase [bacterium]